MTGVQTCALPISKALEEMLEGKTYSEKDLFEADGVWHSWMHHSNFSSDSSAEECLHRINGRLIKASESLASTEWLLVTWGTAFVYEHEGQVVGNCHKQPDRLFVRRRLSVDEIVEKSLRGAAIWDEVKDRLHDNAYGLSGGQQQRICIARCLAIEPDVILMDEPTSALDPISTLKVEELVQQLKENYSIVIVTHNMQQAARISDKTAFFLNGEVIEFDQTNKIFSTPQDMRTEDYISGRFG